MYKNVHFNDNITMIKFNKFDSIITCKNKYDTQYYDDDDLGDNYYYYYDLDNDDDYYDDDDEYEDEAFDYKQQDLKKNNIITRNINRLIELFKSFINFFKSK